MHKLKEYLMNELAEWEEQTYKSNGEKLSNTDLDRVYKLTDTVKNIDKIEMLEEESGYSSARGRGSNANRDRMGRYSSNGNMNGGSSYRNGGYSNNYAYGDATGELMQKAEELLGMTDNPEQRKAIEEFKRSLNNMK